MVGEHDGDCLGRLSGGLRFGRSRREDDIDIYADQLGRQLRQLVDRFRPAKFNDEVLAFDIAELAQAGPQRLDPVSPSSGWTNLQEPDNRHRALLRVSPEWPRRRAAKQRDELASLHY